MPVMAYTSQWSRPEPTRSQIDALPGASVIEFGTPWCGFCLRAQPLIGEALAAYPQVRHLKVEDGRGFPLGRSFGVKLWPTLVFLRDGREVARLVRPGERSAIDAGLAQIASGATPRRPDAAHSAPDAERVQPGPVGVRDGS